MKSRLLPFVVALVVFALAFFVLDFYIMKLHGLALVYQP